MLEHGGRLAQFAGQYDIPLADWLDLSTGINPIPWPVPEIPAAAWQRLPDDDDELETAADEYYGGNNCLAVAGSQAAIQALPQLRGQSRVGVLALTYNEYAHAWRQAGHEVVALSAGPIETNIQRLDVLILVNPNNPTGERFSREQLLSWHATLSNKKGWLIVDEAFMDVAPENSLTDQADRSGLVVLRSVGKFFGLAGARCGFVFCDGWLRTRLREKLGPWSVTGPSRWVVQRALQDRHWRQQTRQRLLRDSRRLSELLRDFGLTPQGGTALFQWFCHPQAEQLQAALARQGICVRRFDEPAGLRFGLPGREEDWQRLEQALSALSAGTAVAQMRG